MARLHGFTKTQILDVFRKMALSRRLDEKMLILLRQGKSYFHTGASGHEAAQLAAAVLIRPGEDWSYPYYRDGAYCIGLGMTAREQLLCSGLMTLIPAVVRCRNIMDIRISVL